MCIPLFSSCLCILNVIRVCIREIFGIVTPKNEYTCPCKIGMPPCFSFRFFIFQCNSRLIFMHTFLTRVVQRRFVEQVCIKSAWIRARFTVVLRHTKIANGSIYLFFNELSKFSRRIRACLSLVLNAANWYVFICALFADVFKHIKMTSSSIPFLHSKTHANHDWIECIPIWCILVSTCIPFFWFVVFSWRVFRVPIHIST